MRFMGVIRVSDHLTSKMGQWHRCYRKYSVKCELYYVPGTIG